MKKFKALIFDMNGTMINDMHYHEMAWHDVLVNQLNAPLTIDDVRHQIYGTAAEMFQRVFGTGKFTEEEIATITERKESRYRQEFLPDLKLINGLDRYLDLAQTQRIPMAIGTAAPVANIDFVVDNLKLRHYFPVIIGPGDVQRSKPDPEVFLLAAQRLGVDAADCVVFEDAPKGIEAAFRAGMAAVAITSYHTAHELQNENVLFATGDYHDPRLNQLF
ncbi:MAG: HAD family hydrolase [Bacteroidota bacterium]